MGYGPPVVVEAEPRRELPYGLFSVLALRQSSDPHWMNGITWESVSCDPVTGADWQDDPDCDTDFDKFFRGPGENGEATQFITTGSYLCGAPGGPAYSRGKEFAEADLLAHEQQQAEAFVWRKLAAEASDLNAAGAVSPEEGLALLEGWMGDFGSLGVIHLPREAASILSKRLNPSGSRLTTKIGSPVVAGSGYPGTSPAGAAPAAGEVWAFVSPALFGYRGEVMSHAVLDRTKNDHYALAERPYVVGFDPCGVGAVRLDLSG